MKVLVLGAGKMVEAILTGFKKTDNLSEWMIYSPSGSSAQKLAGKVGARAVSDLGMVKNPDWILVGCKPQQLPNLKDTLKGQFRESLFVSILAALSEEEQLRILEGQELIRVMPNLPVEHNEGISLLTSNSAKGRLSSFQTLFSKLGSAVCVSEDELEELTLLTGSGPALFYTFARELAESFSSLDEAQREKLVRQVLRGAGTTLRSTNSDLVTLTSAVTSKGGVTAAVLEQWHLLGFREFLKKGVEAGRKRTNELRSLLQK
jgi:pyrroline-5-carboxylate reductase